MDKGSQSGKVILVCFGLLVCLGASSFRFNLSKLTQHPSSTFFFSFLLSSFFCLSCHLSSSHPSSLFLLLLEILELQKQPPLMNLTCLHYLL